MLETSFIHSIEQIDSEINEIAEDITRLGFANVSNSSNLDNIGGIEELNEKEYNFDCNS